MRYLPHTESEISEMLARIGVKSMDELFRTIPKNESFKGKLALEPQLDEPSLMAHLEELAQKNTAARMLSFAGAGMYDHHIPPAVDQLLLRSEFYTAYTPYQAEVSQGTLQATFEFQTIVAELLGMEVANASMYDGASALAEAAIMARRLTGRTKIVASAALHPEYLDTLRTYLNGLDHGAAQLELVGVAKDGRTDLGALESKLGGAAALLVGYPNFFGIVEDLGACRQAATQAGALFVTATTEPYALSLLKPPGAFGADIAVGEGQALATPPQFGGPGVGLFACRKDHVRQMPGRLVGETVDAEGRRGYVLTLSTREQHIRRERATSNICTNHGLIALSLAIRTSMLGRAGFTAAGKLCLSNAEYLKSRVRELQNFTLPYSAATFNEFVVRSKKTTARDVLAALAKREILGGVDLGRFDPKLQNDFAVAVTERHRKADLDRFVDALAAI